MLKMFAGKDLINTFQNIGINIGNVNKLTINSWFETDDRAMLDVLNFIAGNFQKENVLTAQEHEEYEDLLENNRILYDKEYEDSLKEIESDFVGILDWKTKENDTNGRKSELELLVKKEKDLESCVENDRIIKKNLTKQMNHAKADNAYWESRRRNAVQRCVELGESLDNARNKLHKQISSYAEQLNEFENSACPTFLSNVPLKKYEQYVTEIKSCFNLMANDNVTSIIPHLQNSYICESAGNLEMLRERIISSKKCLLDKLIEFEQLKAEIQYMETLNIDRLLLLSYNNDDNSHVNLEVSMFSSQLKLDHFVLSAEECLKKDADMMVDKPKINAIQNAIHNDRKKLQHLNLQDGIITKICSLQKLYYVLLEKENTDIKATDTFFREIYLYITENLAGCELCIESMLKITDEYETYKNIPVQKKYKIFELLKQLHLSEEQTEGSLMSAIRDFWDESDNAIGRIVTHKINTTMRHSKQLLLQIDTLQKFVSKGSASEISIMPFEVFDYVNKISERVEEQGKSLQTAISSLNNAKKRLANEKWFKLRRQLWMWFIVDPKKVLQIIDEVEAAVKSARKNVT